WVYSVSVDIQGYLVEKLSGQPFADFLRERIFEPLGMNDTAFFVPQNKLSRLAPIYQLTAQGLAPMPRDPGVSAPPGFPSGGGGLYSTMGDYLRFAQMLANRGELNGARVLAPSSVALMTSNAVPDVVKAAGKFGIGAYRQQPGFGFGFDVAIYEEPTRIGSRVGHGPLLWGGLAGTGFWVDPTHAPQRLERRRGRVPVARHRRHVVLGRPDERHRVRRHHPALGRPIARPEHRGSVARADDAGARRSVEVAAR